MSKCGEVGNRLSGPPVWPMARSFACRYRRKVRYRGMLLSVCLLMSACSPEEAENNSESAKIIRYQGATVCAPGFHPESESSRTCVEDQIDYGSERRLQGHLIVDVERFTFVPATPVEGHEAIREFWIEFAEESQTDCWVAMRSSRGDALNLGVELLARVAERSDRGFGHMGAYQGQIYVSTILSGACQRAAT